MQRDKSRLLVVDIGANPIDGDPPYKSMIGDLFQVVGFEPQPHALAELRKRAGPHELYLMDCIADGEERTLYTCPSPGGMTSLLRPNKETLSMFPGLDYCGMVQATELVRTCRLDDIAAIEDMDYLKMDVQGSELDVIRHGKEKLKHTTVIQLEVSFVALYHDQPLWWEVDRELRRQGFVFHKFESVKAWPLTPHAQSTQVIEADAVYVKDFMHLERLTNAQLIAMASILDYCYQSHDLARIVRQFYNARKEAGQLKISLRLS